MKGPVALVCVPPWLPRLAPLGVAYLAEYLDSRGIPVRVVDFNVELYRSSGGRGGFWDIGTLNFTLPEHIADKMCAVFQPEIDALVERLLATDCATIGFSTTIASIGLAARLARLIKQRDGARRTVIGGTGCFWPVNRVIIDRRDLPFVDAFVLGEGEHPLEEIVMKDSCDGITGVLSRKTGFDLTVDAWYAPDLDALPFPTFTGFDLDAYESRLVPLLFSRGCIGRCVFCIDHLMCGRFRWRDPRSVVEEMKFHVSRNGRTEFGLNDLLCNGNLRQLEAICDLIIAENLQVSWGGYAMVRKEMGPGLLKKLRAAGCAYLCYGLESGCDRTLSRMNKLYTSAEAERVIRDTHAAGIKTAVNVIAGFPRETEDDYRETVNWVCRNAPYISEVTNVSSFIPMPDSPLGRDQRKFGISGGFSSSSWTDDQGTDLAVRVRRVRRMVFQLSLLDVKTVVINEAGLTKPAFSRIALVSLPPRDPEHVPAGLFGLRSRLEARGLETFVFDLNSALSAEFYPGGLSRYWGADAYLWGCEDNPMTREPEMFERVFAEIDRLLSHEPAVVYLDTEAGNAMSCAWFSRMFRKYRPETRIVAGGGAFLDGPWAARLFAVMGVDIVPAYNAEEALAEMVCGQRAFGERSPVRPEGLEQYRDGVVTLSWRTGERYEKR